VKRGIWPAFLTLAFIGFGLLGLWDMTHLAFMTLDAIRSQIQGEPLKPPAAPSWAPGPEPNAAGYPIRDIPLGGKDEGVMALGVNNAGDYAPLIMQNEGAVRAAGKWRDEKMGRDHWVAIQVDAEGRVICSPDSFKAMARMFNLKPGERIEIHGPPAGGQP
jgi:hypothetical protein